MRLLIASHLLGTPFSPFASCTISSCPSLALGRNGARAPITSRDRIANGLIANEKRHKLELLYDQNSPRRNTLYTGTAERPESDRFKSETKRDPAVCAANA
uniref:Putative secreted protein n=1 Tax=Anopheles marajoara TaxID=58244 RepID=A0A2M4C8T9_9DIPT